jgi:hypothetical protein
MSGAVAVARGVGVAIAISACGPPPRLRGPGVVAARHGGPRGHR